MILEFFNEVVRLAYKKLASSPFALRFGKKDFLCLNAPCAFLKLRIQVHQCPPGQSLFDTDSELEQLFMTCTCAELISLRP